MATYKMVVLTNALAGQEDALEAWYRDGHMADMRDVPGVVAAERFVLSGRGVFRNLVILDVETDDLAAFVAECGRRDGTELMPATDALDRQDILNAIYTPVSPPDN
jgi:hypothetical protein